MIKSATYGGADACPITIGQTVQTQTGVSTGNITTKGFDARIGSNTDSFSDVFGQDANGNYYVKKAHNYPAYSGGGSGLTVYLTPVSAALPDSWTAQFGDFTPGNPSPIVYRLVS